MKSCRESKTVQYGVQFHPPWGCERRRKAKAGVSSRGLKGHGLILGRERSFLAGRGVGDRYPMDHDSKPLFDFN